MHYGQLVFIWDYKIVVNNIQQVTKKKSFTVFDPHASSEMINYYWNVVLKYYNSQFTLVCICIATVDMIL